MTEDNDFYKEKAWELLIKEISDFKNDLLNIIKSVRNEIKDNTVSREKELKIITDRLDNHENRMDGIEYKVYYILIVASVILFLLQYIAPVLIDKLF